MDKPQSVDNEQTVYIVDDNEAVRKALSLLVKSDGLTSRGFSSALEFLEALPDLNFGCLLLDVYMPDMTGLELQKILHERKTDIPVIVITGHGDVPTAVASMKWGAFDFVEKPFDAEDLLRRIHSCLDAEKNQREKVEERKQAVSRLTRLTPRERQVFEALVAGQRNKQIAESLFISIRTVELHRAKIMGKLQANTLSDIVRIALLADDI